MKKKHILLIILSVIILVIFVYFILNQERKLTIIETIIKEPILYVQRIVIKPINIFKENINKDQIKNNDNLLKSELEEKNRRIQEFEKLLDVDKNFSNYKTINASVINRSVGLWYQTFTIDKGTNNKIELDDAVVDNYGLIGKVVKTTSNTSTIKLLTSLNDNFKIAVLIKNGEDDVFGILSKYENGEFIIRDISYNKEIQKDSIVITSGLDNNFPSGLLVGKVKYVKKDNYELEQIVSVIPASKFDDINYVSVLKRAE